MYRNKLDLINHLNDNYFIVVGGSTALEMYGLHLNRSIGNGDSDIDIIIPTEKELIQDDFILRIENFPSTSPGSDFDKSYKIWTIGGGTIKVDVRIDPICEWVTLSNHLKINKLSTILEAKCRYALDGNIKHLMDVGYLFSTQSEKIQSMLINEKLMKKSFNSLAFLD